MPRCHQIAFLRNTRPDEIAVERMWRTQDSNGQIMALASLAFGSKALKPFKVLDLRPLRCWILAFRCCMLPLKVLDLGLEAVQVRRSLLRYEGQALRTWTSLTLSLLHALTGGNAVLEHLTRTVPLSLSLTLLLSLSLSLSHTHFLTLTDSLTHTLTLSHALTGGDAVLERARAAARSRGLARN